MLTPTVNAASTTPVIDISSVSSKAELSLTIFQPAIAPGPSTVHGTEGILSKSATRTSAGPVSTVSPTVQATSVFQTHSPLPAVTSSPYTTDISQKLMTTLPFSQPSPQKNAANSRVIIAAAVLVILLLLIVLIVAVTITVIVIKKQQISKALLFRFYKLAVE